MVKALLSQKPLLAERVILLDRREDLGASDVSKCHGASAAGLRPGRGSRRAAAQE